jgi:hypothetical protein
MCVLAFQYELVLKGEPMLLGIAIATISSFVFSAILYGLPPVAKLMAKHSTPRPGIPTAVQMLLVMLRSLVTAIVIAGLMVAAGWHGPADGALLGLALAPFPAMLLLGGVIHENTPVALACVHLVDWVAKLVIIGALVGLFV